jgi:hypothetical protein
MKKITRFMLTVTILALGWPSLAMAVPMNNGTVQGFTTLAETDCKYCFVPKPDGYFGCYIVVGSVNLHIAQAFAQYVDGDDNIITCHGDLEPGACATFTGTIVNADTTSEDPPFALYQLEVTSWELLAPGDCDPPMHRKPPKH